MTKEVIPALAELIRGGKEAIGPHKRCVLVCKGMQEKIKSEVITAIVANEELSVREIADQIVSDIELLLRTAHSVAVVSEPTGETDVSRLEVENTAMRLVLGAIDMLRAA